ncbi:globin domain-containing protein [Zhongshania arctica]|uniref:Globin domain-containing protein n=1 Tax=Zhongshania arctica TaxID=3238302 RepID=A0ABV3TY29_9GAMM
MTPKQITIVQAQLPTVKSIGKPFAKVFYARLFQLAPDLRTLFSEGKHRDRQLIDTLCTTVNSLQNMDGLRVVAHNMGQRYSELGVSERHYDFFMQAMLETLGMALGDEFSGEVKAAWLNLLTTLKDTLLEACNYHEIEHPAWGSEVPMALVG